MSDDRSGETFLNPPDVTADMPFPTPRGFIRTGPNSMVMDTPENRDRIARGVLGNHDGHGWCPPHDERDRQLLRRVLEERGEPVNF
jgi:hypothetical protein